MAGHAYSSGCRCSTCTPLIHQIVDCLDSIACPLLTTLPSGTKTLSANIVETVRRARRSYLAGANPARQLSLPPVAIGAAEGGNDLG